MLIIRSLIRSSTSAENLGAGRGARGTQEKSGGMLIIRSLIRSSTSAGSGGEPRRGEGRPRGREGGLPPGAQDAEEASHVTDSISSTAGPAASLGEIRTLT